MEGTSGVDKEKDNMVLLGKETNDGDIIKENQEADKKNNETLVATDKINEVELIVANKTNDGELNVSDPKVIV